MARRLDAALDALERASDHPPALAEPFLTMFPVTGAAIATLGSFLGSETISASDALAARLDEVQFDLGEGPCWDAMSFARPVLEPDIRSEPRRAWPAFSPAIADMEVASLFAFPLTVGTLRIGAIDLYCSKPVVLDEQQTHEASAMAHAVSRQVLRRALDDLGGDYDAVGNAFSRRLIHQATGMVLAQLRITADDARLVIQGHAFVTGRPMMEVAQDILDRELTFTQGTEGIETA